MATTTSQIEAAGVRKAQEQFERWRPARQGREQIPGKLWGMAAKLCEIYSIHQVARSLRLNYTALKAQVTRRLGFPPRKVAAAARPNFIEWSLPGGIVPGPSSAEYVVEVEGSGRQRVHVRGASASEVVALVRALGGEGRASA